MTDPDERYDPYEEFPYTGAIEEARGFMEEGQPYHGVSIKYVIQSLKVGDVVRVVLERKGNPEHILEVVDFDIDRLAVVEMENGKEVHLWDESQYRNKLATFGEPWLRELEGSSIGVVQEIEVQELNNE